jgi:DNA-binding MarR family transcriptional regulator
MTPGPFDFRHPLVGLVDEVIRINGRLKSLFAESRQITGLGQSEMMVLNAVVEAERAPTAAQIGRSLGQPRQLVQRAADALIAEQLIETAPNPDHKRAVLLKATPRGVEIKRMSDARAEEIAAGFDGAVDLEGARAATQALRSLRRQLEAQLRRGEE